VLAALAHAQALNYHSIKIKNAGDRPFRGNTHDQETVVRYAIDLVQDVRRGRYRRRTF
jgi:hypothetical protein